MLKVAYLHFADDTARDQRSGWYIIDERGAIAGDTRRYDHQGSAIRALCALLNAPAFA